MEGIDRNNSREEKVLGINKMEASKTGKLQKLVMSAILAVAPQIGCTMETDSETTNSLSDSAEVAQPLGRIHLGIDSNNWMVSGNSQKDFVLRVYAGNEVQYIDGKLQPVESSEILSDEVFVRNGKFDFDGGSGIFDSAYVRIEAKKADGSGEKIEISSSPNADGLLGVAYAFNIDHDQLRESNCGE
jgi:hypothetical protein